MRREWLLKSWKTNHNNIFVRFASFGSLTVVCINIDTLAVVEGEEKKNFPVCLRLLSLKQTRLPFSTSSWQRKKL
jgi:hypothetical protein